MGVHGLRKFLQEKNPDIFRKVPLSSFKGSRIAIDLAFWLHQNANGVWKPLALKAGLNDNLEVEVPTGLYLVQLFKRFIDFITMLMREGITPLCIFDGDHPKLKEVKYARYKVLNEKAAANMASLRDICVNQEKYSPTLVIDARNKILQLHAAKADVSNDDYEQIAMWIRQLGLPYLAAKEEAEGLASYLCIDGLVSAVYSKDTDTMVYGCPCTIFSISQGGNGKNTVDLMEIYPILKTLDMSYELFRDMCILFETDFNTRIKGLGEKKIHAALTETRSLELMLLLSQPQYRNHPAYLPFCQSVSTNTKAAWNVLEKAGTAAINALHIEGNREIFKYRKSSDEIKMGRMDIGKVDPGIRSTLRMYQIESLLDGLLAAMIDLPAPGVRAFWYPGTITVPGTAVEAAGVLASTPGTSVKSEGTITVPGTSVKSDEKLSVPGTGPV
jgi:5'-3' exonuclease